MQYFAYRTTTRIDLVSPIILRHHDVALCIKFIDILHRDSLFKATGITVTAPDKRDEASLQVSTENESKLTLAHIFDYTPKPEEIIDTCMFRPNEWLIQFANDSDCRQLFTVTRFLSQGNLCYMFHKDTRVSLQRTSVTLSPHHTSRVYEMMLNERLSRANLVTAVTLQRGMPWLSREYATPPVPFHTGSGNESESKAFNFLQVTPSDTRIQRLPAPYDTMCVFIGADSSYECLKDCLLQYYSLHGLAPPSSILLPEDGRHLRLLNQHDVASESGRNMFDGYSEACSRKCNIWVCQFFFSRTTAVVMKRRDTFLGFALTTPLQPDVLMHSMPTMSFIDFFSFIGSCFGTWFGLSCLSLDPFGCRKRAAKKERRQRMNWRLGQGHQQQQQQSFAIERRSWVTAKFSHNRFM